MLEKHGIACDLMHQPAPVPESPFYVYAILCDDDSVYIGQTDDLLKRWGEHRRGTGAEWTKKHPPVRIAHYELAATREEAVTMEKEWKTGFGRKRIKRLIENGTARQAGGFNWDKWTSGKPTERLALIPAGQEHILEQDYDGRADGPPSAARGRRLEDQAPYPTVRQRFTKIVTELSRAFALCAASDEATETQPKLTAFNQAIKTYDTLRSTPRQAKAAQSAATKHLARAFPKVERILAGRIDKLMVQFKSSNPEFYDKYQTARSIVSAGARTEKAPEKKAA